MELSKLKKYFPYLYVLFLVIITIFVKTSLSEEKIDVKEIESKDEDRTAMEIKPVKVKLVIEANGNVWIYEKRMQNIDTFDDLLEELRDENEIFFEKTEYTYGTEYHDIKNIEIPKDFVWSVYAGGENVTYNTKDLLLNDGWVYRLVLEKK